MSIGQPNLRPEQQAAAVSSQCDPGGNGERRGKIVEFDHRSWRQFDDGVRLRERKRDNEPVLIGDRGEAARWEARRIVEGNKVPKLDVAREPRAERDGRPALRHAVFEPRPLGRGWRRE